MAKKKTVEKLKLADLGEMRSPVIIIGIGIFGLKLDKEYNVSKQTAVELVNKGYAKLKK